MTFAQAAGLLVRLFALWVFLLSLQSLGAAFALRNSLGPGHGGNDLLIWLPCLAFIGIGVFLWRFPLAVARILIPRGAERASAITVREAWSLGCVLVGLLTLQAAAPEVLRCLALVYFGVSSDYGSFSPELKAALLSAGARTAMGLFLVFGSSHIHQRFGRLPRVDFAPEANAAPDA